MEYNFHIPDLVQGFSYEENELNLVLYLAIHITCKTVEYYSIILTTVCEKDSHNRKTCQKLGKIKKISLMYNLPASKWLDRMWIRFHGNFNWIPQLETSYAWKRRAQLLKWKKMSRETRVNHSFDWFDQSK